MAKLKKKDKIIKIVNKLGIFGQAQDLLLKMIEDADEFGFIKQYSDYEKKYIIDLYKNDSAKYYEALLKLHTEIKVIYYDRENDAVFIKPFSERHCINFIINIKNNKRKYTRDLIKDRQLLKQILSDGKYGIILSEIYENTDVIYNTNTYGFKVTDSFRPYLTSEPLSERDISTLIKHNKDRLVLEEQRRNLTKEEKRAFCACIAFADSNGIIEDYNIHSLVHSIRREFGDKSFCTATMYQAINRLQELKLIEEYTDKKTGLKCLKITQYKESFDRNEHYVIIPNVVFKKAFKKLQASSIKLFFYFIFLLNNGEDKNEYKGQNKAIFFKIDKLSMQGQESKVNFEQQLLWLKKRYPGELKTLLWGDIKDKDFIALSEFFHFHCTSDTALQIRIRKEYFISKKAYKFKQLLALKGRYKKRTATIEEALKTNEIEYTPEDLVGLIRIFKGASGRVIKYIISQLADRIRKAKEDSWSKVKTIPGYVAYLYARYKEKSEAFYNDPGSSLI